MKAKRAEIAFLNHTAAVALDAGDNSTAEADARESMALGQDSGIAIELLAAALDAQGKTQEALQVYQTMVVNEKAGYPRVVLPYALLLLKVGQWEQALAAYEEARPLVSEQNSLVEPHLDQTFSPNDPQPTELAAAIHVALGLTYNGGSDWAGNSQGDKALDQYRQALALAPDWSLANYYYGYGLRRMNQRQEAQAAFKKAAALDVNNGDVKAAAENALAGR